MINETINWAEAEKQYYKERDWLIEVKTLCERSTLTLKRLLPPETSKWDHYNNIVEEAYQRAKSIGATYLICASNWLPVLCFSESFEKTKTPIAITGSYEAGIVKGLPVIITPCLDSFEMLCGADTPTPEYSIENIDASKFILLKLED